MALVYCKEGVFLAYTCVRGCGICIKAINLAVRSSLCDNGGGADHHYVMMGEGQIIIM